MPELLPGAPSDEEVLDYLGRQAPRSFQGQPALPVGAPAAAAAVGPALGAGPSAPAMVAPAAIPGSQTLGPTDLARALAGLQALRSGAELTQGLGAPRPGSTPSATAPGAAPPAPPESTALPGQLPEFTGALFGGPIPAEAWDQLFGLQPGVSALFGGPLSPENISTLTGTEPASLGNVGAGFAAENIARLPSLQDSGSLLDALGANPGTGLSALGMINSALRAAGVDVPPGFGQALGYLNQINTIYQGIQAMQATEAAATGALEGAGAASYGVAAGAPAAAISATVAPYAAGFTLSLGELLKQLMGPSAHYLNRQEQIKQLYRAIPGEAGQVFQDIGIQATPENLWSLLKGYGTLGPQYESSFRAPVTMTMDGQPVPISDVPYEQAWQQILAGNLPSGHVYSPATQYAPFGMAATGDVLGEAVARQMALLQGVQEAGGWGAPDNPFAGVIQGNIGDYLRAEAAQAYGTTPALGGVLEEGGGGRYIPGPPAPVDWTSWVEQALPARLQGVVPWGPEQTAALLPTLYQPSPAPAPEQVPGPLVSWA